jgi:hypothetical protein
MFFCNSYIFLEYLCRYGFADWQANMAIRMCGSDLEECLDWLLRNGTNMQMDMRLQHEETMVDQSFQIISIGSCSQESCESLCSQFDT